MDMSYDWYRIFQTVADCGSITGAAEKLHVSQPAVSQSLRQLEDSLGCELFMRTPKGVALTAEGQLLLPYVDRGIELIRGGEKRLEAQLLLESGRIDIGASDMTLEYYLLPYLEEFHRLYPNIRISVTNGPTPETIRKLTDGAIDFGVVSEPLPTLGSGFTSVPVREIEDIVICGTAYQKLAETAMPPEKLQELPLIMLEENTSTRTYINTFLGQQGVAVQPEFELATSSLIVQFVQRNLGVGFVVRDFAENALECGQILELKLSQRVPKRNICILRNTKIVSKASAKLLELMGA